MAIKTLEMLGKIKVDQRAKVINKPSGYGSEHVKEIEYRDNGDIRWVNYKNPGCIGAVVSLNDIFVETYLWELEPIVVDFDMAIMELTCNNYHTMTSVESDVITGRYDVQSGKAAFTLVEMRGNWKLE